MPAIGGNWNPSSLTTKGALGSFHQAMEAGETVWEKHVQTIKSNSASETLVFPGFLPAPRQFLNGRMFQSARDFTYTVTNNEYELSMVVDRKVWEDDQVGLINARFAEMGETWRTYKDSLFSTLLTNGNVSTNNGWDGVTFHSDDHSAGSSTLTSDNNITENITDTAVITATEAQLSAGLARRTFLGFTDDQGRPFNNAAIGNMRVIIPPGHEGGFKTATMATVISQTGNVFVPSILQGVDVLPYLTGTTEVFYSALGSVRKPFIYQERDGLEVIMLSDAENVAVNNGVMVLTRQRFIMTYGEPRRSLLDTYT